MSLKVKGIEIDANTQKNIDEWLNGHYDEKTKDTIRRLLEENPQQIVDAFYTKLSFGTAGMRGIMGVGSNCMNEYTVRAATQALANHLSKQPKSPRGQSVFIGYDSRHQSQFFAEEAAKVLAANGIRSYLCQEMRPTPLVSFGCRYKKCSAGIMITASHNPPQYNGYKVYWKDGGQILPPHDQSIVAEFDAITDVTLVKKVDSLESPLIQLVGEEIDNAYFDAIAPLQNYPEDNQKHGDSLKIVYTSLHGTGITLMPRAFALWGFSDINLVPTQVIPDGDFPTAPFPNPEIPQALTLGIKTLKEVNGDILIATDPDADRVGVVVKHNNEPYTLNGSQIACLCLDHICKAWTEQHRMPLHGAFIKTIVTTEMFQTIADHYQKPCFNVLTGFKYIAEKIRLWEENPNGYQYIFGGEESYGYLFGTQTRDKDAILSGVLICEIALHAKRQNKTLVDLMDDLYLKYGVYFENVISVDFENSKEGQEKMEKAMERLRDNPPKSIANVEVEAIEDYQSSLRVHLKTGQTERLTLPESNVLLFWLADGSKFIVRPSGTEPKIKLYCGVVNKQIKSVPDALEECRQRSGKYLEVVRSLML